MQLPHSVCATPSLEQRRMGQAAANILCWAGEDTERLHFSSPRAAQHSWEFCTHHQDVLSDKLSLPQAVAASHYVYDLLPERVCGCGEPEPAAPEVRLSGARGPSSGRVGTSAPDGVSHAGHRRSGAAISYPAHPGHLPAAARGHRRAVGSQHVAALAAEGLFVHDDWLLADADRLYAVQTNLGL